jgi:hypothetical protein
MAPGPGWRRAEVRRAGPDYALEAGAALDAAFAATAFMVDDFSRGFLRCGLL